MSYNMIYINYTFINLEWPDEFTQLMMNDFPEEEKKRVEKVNRWMDRQAKIAGRKLLQHGLEALKLAPEKLTLKYNAHQKPFLEEGPFFNISHSGNYVVCAISEEAEVGIDIEKKSRKRFPDIPSAFTEQEKTLIENHPDRLYDIWTKKEAIVKADGRGLQHKLNDIETGEVTICWKGKQFTTKEVAIDPEYVCHVAYAL